MTKMLDLGKSGAEAAEGCFFYDPSQESVHGSLTAFQFAEEFHEQYKDVLTHDRSLVISRGINIRGELMGLDSRVDMADLNQRWHETIMLVFDISRHEEGVYGWQINRAPWAHMNQTKTRQIDTLYVSRDGWAGRTWHYDCQGMVSPRVDVTDPSRLQADVVRLASQPEVDAKALRSRAEKETMKKVLAGLIERAQNNPGPILERDIKNMTEKVKIDGIGFSPSVWKIRTESLQKLTLVE